MDERRQAAKRLCLELDNLGVTALPDGRTMTITGVIGKSRQTVALRTLRDRGLMWCFVWPGTEITLDPVMPLGEEAVFAQRVHSVLTIPPVEEL